MRQETPDICELKRLGGAVLLLTAVGCGMKVLGEITIPSLERFVPVHKRGRVDVVTGNKIS